MQVLSKDVNVHMVVDYFYGSRDMRGLQKDAKERSQNVSQYSKRLASQSVTI